MPNPFQNFAINMDFSSRSVHLCNIAITNFRVLHMCEIRFHDVIGQSTVHMHSYAKLLKHG